jgi:N-acetyl-anhydromuramyl-L-alanine amidase AmpD
MLDVSKIIQYQLATNQYFPEDCSNLKKIIVIHHTAGGSNPFVVVDGWNSNPDRVGTAFVIAGAFVSNSNHQWKDGDIIQCFSSKFYNYHLGISTANNTQIAKASIGIEVCNWGSLALVNGKYYTYTGKEIPATEVVSYSTPFRTHPKSTYFDSVGQTGKPAYYYHKYTDAQIASLKELMVYLCDKFGISKSYKADMWDVNTNALAGDGGIWTHVSYRHDKNDMHPSPSLVNMLKSLASNI